MVTIAIEPGQGAGAFQLGDTLWQVLDHVRANQTQYPKIDISWDTAHPQTSPVTVHLAHITLFFPSPAQRLSLIQFPSLATSPLTLTIGNEALASPAAPLKVGRVARVLGPTKALANGRLEYPGIEFAVADGASGAGSGSSGGGSSSSSGRDSLVESVVVKAGDDFEPEEGAVRCTILPNDAIQLWLAGAQRDVKIVVGVSEAQDLLCELGAPVRQYFKEDDRMGRMWGAPVATTKTQVFWNYFHLGLDFLIVGETVEKILVHSNVVGWPASTTGKRHGTDRQPGTPLFQQYARCPWVLPSPSGDLTLASPASAFTAHMARIAHEANTAAKSADDADAATTPATGPGDEEEVMVLDRTVEGGLEGVLGVGPSRLHGYKGLIIEEDEQSGAICAVLVFYDE